MRELRAVEVEADRPLGAILRSLAPLKLRLPIDETPDQPRRSDPIDPEVFAGSPRASPIRACIACRYATGGGMRLVSRETSIDGTRHVRKRGRQLLPRCTWEKVDGDHRVEVTADTEQRPPRGIFI